MNRRSFLTRLGVAAVGAAALAVDDPERLLWTPGAKTIIDFGATKQVVPATDAEVIDQAIFLAEDVPLEEFRRRFISTPDQTGWVKKRFLEDGDQLLRRDRDITLTIGSTNFKYQGEQLVSLHSEAELNLLDLPFTPNPRRRYA